jgi:FSR family fosmidomycin resistance protein-like MFS transporter
MSYFMAGGELGRAVGPLLIVWAVATWGLDGIWRLAVIGWVTTAFLYWRLRNTSIKSERKDRGSLRLALPRIRRLFVPLTAVMFLRSFVVTGLSVYLVVFLTENNYSLENASQALALWSFAGIGGALAGGTLSDRIGRRRMMVLGIITSALLLFVMLNVDGLALILVLILLGFTALAVTPVIQAMVQENLVEHRAMANGMFMLVAFLARSLATLIIGYIGDTSGLQTAFVVCAFAALLSLPLIYLLPGSGSESQSA